MSETQKNQWAKTFRVVTYVPQEALKGFMESVSPHIPAFTGDYDRVAWWSEPGVEQYGMKDHAELKTGPSVRVEFSIPDDEQALETFTRDVLKRHHPWKEPVILVFEARFLCS